MHQNHNATCPQSQRPSPLLLTTNPSLPPLPPTLANLHPHAQHATSRLPSCSSLTDPPIRSLLLLLSPSHSHPSPKDCPEQEKPTDNSPTPTPNQTHAPPKKEPRMNWTSVARRTGRGGWWRSWGCLCHLKRGGYTAC